ncbi:MAG: hypothetical protein IKW28_11085 [Lachnospiraceae bacterium]|nr:hypothetical protein [Lachnospiraceae bacterium]
MICKNCGGKLEEQYSYCPYCGCVNELMADKHYINEMKNISRDLEELPEETREIYQSAARKEINKTIRIILIILGILFILIFLSGLLALSFREDPKTMEKELQWEREYFPVLDELYENKEYDKILSFMEEHYEDSGQCYYLWDNYVFIDLYARYQECLRQKEIMDNKIETGKYSDAVLIYDSCQVIYYRQMNREHKWETKQEKQLSLWSDEMEAFLREYVNLTEEQTELLEEFIDNNGYLSYELCEKLEKQIRK